MVIRVAATTTTETISNILCSVLCITILTIIIWMCCWHIVYYFLWNVGRCLFPIKYEYSGWCHWGKKLTVARGTSVEGRPTDKCWDLAEFQCHLWLACRWETGETLCCMWQVTGFCSSPDVWPTVQFHHPWGLSTWPKSCQSEGECVSCSAWQHYDSLKRCQFIEGHITCCMHCKFIQDSTLFSFFIFIPLWICRQSRDRRQEMTQQHFERFIVIS